MESAHLHIPDDIGVVARLSQACIDTLRALVKAPLEETHLSRTQQRSVRRILQTLVIWGEDHQVPSGKLDSIIVKSARLQQVVILALASIGGVLSSGVGSWIKESSATHASIRNTHLVALVKQSESVIRETESDNEFSEVSDSDEDENADFPSALTELQAATRCLTDLSTTLDDPVLDPETEKEKPVTTDLSTVPPHHHYANCIQESFRRAGSSIVELLGKANYNRSGYLRRLREGTKAEPQHEVTINDTPTFHDSGLGSSLPTLPYVPSVATSTKVSSAKFPPLPSDAPKGNPFECDGCGRPVQIRTIAQWRKHLLEDIRPYNCLSEACQFYNQPFGNREKWAAHIQREHDNFPLLASRECPLCLKSSQGVGIAKLHHFSIHLEDIALSTLPCGVEDQDSSENKSILTLPTSQLSPHLVETDVEDSPLGRNGKESDQFIPTSTAYTPNSPASSGKVVTGNDDDGFPLTFETSPMLNRQNTRANTPTIGPGVGLSERELRKLREQEKLFEQLEFEEKHGGQQAADGKTQLEAQEQQAKLSRSQKFRTCRQCRKDKAKCSPDQPCVRCRILGKACTRPLNLIDMAKKATWHPNSEISVPPFNFSDMADGARWQPKAEETSPLKEKTERGHENDAEEPLPDSDTQFAGYMAESENNGSKGKGKTVVLDEDSTSIPKSQLQPPPQLVFPLPPGPPLSYPPQMVLAPPSDFLLPPFNPNDRSSQSAPTRLTTNGNHGNGPSGPALYGMSGEPPTVTATLLSQMMPSKAPYSPFPTPPPIGRPFMCDQCPQSFDYNHDLKWHKRIHLSVKPFPCAHCGKSYWRKDNLKRHIRVGGCGRTQEPEKRTGKATISDSMLFNPGTPQQQVATAEVFKSEGPFETSVDQEIAPQHVVAKAGKGDRPEG